MICALYISYRSSESTGSGFTHPNSTLIFVKGNWIIIGSMCFSLFMLLIFGVVFTMSYMAFVSPNVEHGSPSNILQNVETSK